jgi:PAS domain S-box-containing protein
MSDKSWASFWENIFVNAPIGIFTTDLAGIITSANRISLEIHGEMIGKIFPDDFVQGHRLNYEIREVYEERVGRLEVEYKIDQLSRTIRLISTLLRDEYYCPVGMLFMCEDITELREVQEKVYDFQKRLDYAGRLREIGILARGVVHDIKHIFSIILNYIFALRKGNRSEEETKHFLEMMERTSHDAIEMTHQILTLSTGETPTQERVNVNRIISELVRIIARSLPDNITLQTDIPKRPLFVGGDSAQIQRMLLNLCLNARDAMPSGGRISIRLGKEKSQKKHPSKPSEYISLNVSDTGQGIKNELREKIFKPFFTTKTGGEGIGLGLSVVKELVEKAGGEIDLKSIPGKGTTFTILLPSSLQKKKSRRPKL